MSLKTDPSLPLTATVYDTLKSIISFLAPQAVGSDDTLESLRADFDKMVREQGAAEIAPRLGLQVSEFRGEFVPALRLAVEATDQASTLSSGDKRIAQLRFLSWAETVAGRVENLTLPSYPIHSSDIMARKQVRAIELVLRALINEKHVDQPRLIDRLRALFNLAIVEKWLKQSEKNDVLTGTLFSELAQIFTHESEFSNYLPIYRGEDRLSFLKDKRETIRTFLEDIRFIRNRVAHHKDLTPAQIDLLDSYYEQILLPVQALCDRRGTKVNPDSYLDVENSVVLQYFGSIKDDLHSIYDKVIEVSEGVTQIKTETEGLKQRTQQTHGAVSILKSRVAIVIAGIVVLAILGVATMSMVFGGKKEVSADPREELQNLGVAWNVDNLQQAILNHDYKTIELFFEGGMSPEAVWSGKTDGTTFLMVFAYTDGPGYPAPNFDSGVANLVEKYSNLINPISDCPTSMYLNNGQEESDFYLNLRGKTDVSNFVKRFCDNPGVIAAINSRIATLKQTGQTSSVDGWNQAISFLTSSN